MIHLSAVMLVALLGEAKPVPTLHVPKYSGPVSIDARLDEPCYTAHAPVAVFVVAGQPEKKAPQTKTWVLWNEEQLLVAFECADDHVVAKPPSGNEQEVDVQDRAEIFLWSGKPDDAYFCMEMAPDGAVHDYKARFYRQFDRTWAAPGWKCAARRTDTGYIIEAAINRDAMGQCGFDLEAGGEFRAGLFRGDYASSGPGAEPQWITWVDAPVPKPDFHIAESFGLFHLDDK